MTIVGCRSAAPSAHSLRAAILAAIVLLAAGSATAQRLGRPDTRTVEFLMYEAIPVPMPDSTLVRVDVAYRIDADFFVPVRTTSADASFPFQRRGEVLVELIDSTGFSHARFIEQIDTGTYRSERDPYSREWHQGMASLQVNPGLYTVVIELTDLDSQRRHLDRSRSIRVAGPRRQALDEHLLFFVAGRPVPSDTLTLMNFGEDIPYGAPGYLFLLLPGAADADTVLIDYTLKVADPSGEAAVITKSGGFQPVRAVQRVLLEPVRSSTGPQYVLKSSPSSRLAGAMIPIGTERLPLRRFSIDLAVRHGASEEKVTRFFRALWPDMPLSLRNVDNALEALRYIVPERVLDSLQEGNFERRRDNLEAFWRARDRTPETAYNEIETEYYLRVDYATKTFGTLRAPDGSRTDRGRIYILYGPPSHTERTLDPANGYKEVWFYERIRKTFTFADRTRSGNYVLISSNAL